MVWGGMPEDEKFDHGFKTSYIVGDVTTVFLKGLHRGSKVVQLFDLNPLINVETRC
jgi:hypothetical protein